MRSYFSVIPSGIATLLLAACASAPDNPTDTTSARSAIIKGTDSDESQDAVVRLVYFNRSTSELGACTGTMIAPNLVLTARHCVARTDEGAACRTDGTPVGAGKVYENRKASDLYVFIGKDRPSFGSGGPKPDGVGSQIIDDGSKTLCSHDVALVVLAEPIANVPISRIRLDGPPTPGEEFTAVGWGVTDKSQDPAVRQQRDLVVDLVGPASESIGISAVEFEVGEGICSGDSGGPGIAKATGAVIGIVSRGGNGQNVEGNPAAGCLGKDTRNIFSFPGGFKDLIMQGFEAAGAEPWLEAGPDPRLAKPGTECTDAATCRSNSCLSVDTTKVCAPVDCKVDACPKNYECKTATDGKNVCEVKPTPTTTSGEASSSCSTGAAGSGGRGGFSSALVLALGGVVAFRMARRSSRSARSERKRAQ